MDRYVKTGRDFLTKYKMDPENVNIDDLCSLFLDEMKKGLEGKKSSLMMIPTYINTESEIPVNEPVIVLDAGGTNFRVATVVFNNNKVPTITKFKKFPMPGTGNETAVGKEEFFDRIAGFMKDSISDSNKIGFCFSYPTKIYPTGDGKLIHFVKEVKAPEVEGSMIGENLLKALKRAGMDSKKEIVILNDTVATLLAGKAQSKQFDSYIGFILGTGTNCSYLEKNTNIKKLNGLFKNHHQAINMESGQFNLFKGGNIDTDFLLNTDKPEEGRFEKMISGAYQGALALIVLKQAAVDELFSDKLKKEILNLSILNPIIIDNFFILNSSKILYIQIYLFM